MTLIDNMAIFVKISAFGIVLILITFLYVIGISFDSILSESQEYLDSRLNYANFDQMSIVLGVSIYAFEAVGTILTVKHSMKKMEKFIKFYLNNL